MGQGFRVSGLMKTSKLILPVGMIFATVFVAQYFELPYINVLSTLFTPTQVQQLSDSSSNTTVIVGLNYSDPAVVHEVANNTETNFGKRTDHENDSKRKHKIPENDFVFQKHEAHNDSSSGSVTTDSTSSLDSIPKDYTEAHNVSLPSENVTADDTSSLDSISKDDIEAPDGSSSDSVTTDDTFLLDSISKNDMDFIFENNRSSDSGLSTSPLTPPIAVEPIPGKDRGNTRTPKLEVISISEMNSLLLQSQASSHYMQTQWSSPADLELLSAKTKIENAPIIKDDPMLFAPLYQNVSMFKRSYELMEQMLKVYVYKEGARPVFHKPALKGIYSSEGWFMKLLESNKQFVTKKPRHAHLFYLPFSSRLLEETLYVPNSHSRKNLVAYLKSYLDTIVEKYPFWNRTGGSDHFLVACHDWAPAETNKIMGNCIRALCNNDIKEGFKFGKDASLPETNIRLPKNPLHNLGGKPPSQRPILAFFAGKMHGYLRPILLQHWQDRDPDMKLFTKMPRKKGETNYIQYMKSSKYCLCPKGYEVNSPRVVEAIFFECVPVIISDNFVPPFFEVLNWESFAVFVAEKDIPNLKNILVSIPMKRYVEMQMRVKKVQQHFLWHARPVKYDMFHMILHSIWYNRVFQTKDSESL